MFMKIMSQHHTLRSLLQVLEAPQLTRLRYWHGSSDTVRQYLPFPLQTREQLQDLELCTAYRDIDMSFSLAVPRESHNVTSLSTGTWRSVGASQHNSHLTALRSLCIEKAHDTQGWAYFHR